MGITFSTTFQVEAEPVVEESEDGTTTTKIRLKVVTQQVDSDTSKSEEALKNSTADRSRARVPSVRKTEEAAETHKIPRGGSGSDQDKDEDEDCLFPTYLKTEGPCKGKFAALEKCVEDAHKNEKWMQKGFCFVPGIALLKCGNAHEDYYEELDKRMNGKS